MAGDWIKMRGGLTEHPKVIAMARILHQSRGFREWIAPGGSGEMNGQIVGNEALRCVTCALLLRVWSRSREYGKFSGDDLVLPHNSAEDLDQMAGVSGVGEAMIAVGWATEENGVTLPNFKEYNVPLTPAERQKAYRKRQQRGVTGRYVDDDETLRLEKRREEKNKKEEEKKSKPKEKTVRFKPPTVDEVAAYCRERSNEVNAALFVDFYTTKNWMVGKNKMKDWRAAVRTWEQNGNQQKPKRGGFKQLGDRLKEQGGIDD